MPVMNPIDLKSALTGELFRLYRNILQELTRRGIVRTMNAPAGDYAEYLVAPLMRGELADNSEKSWDVMTPEGERLQVKCRVVDPDRPSARRQLSPFRTWDFDRAVVVLFDERYQVYRCASIPREVIQTRATHRGHVNGYVVRATDELMGGPSRRRPHRIAAQDKRGHLVIALVRRSFRGATSRAAHNGGRDSGSAAGDARGRQAVMPVPTGQPRACSDTTGSRASIARKGARSGRSRIVESA